MTPDLRTRLAEALSDEVLDLVCGCVEGLDYERARNGALRAIMPVLLALEARRATDILGRRPRRAGLAVGCWVSVTSVVNPGAFCWRCSDCGVTIYNKHRDGCQFEMVNEEPEPAHRGTPGTD